MDLQRVKSAMARLATPRSTIQGTAFLVDAQLMLTCAHCIASDPAGADLIPQLEFTEWPEQMRRSFDSGELTLLNVDRVRDLALIRLDRSIPDGVQPLPLASDAMLGDSWTTFAYPEPVGSDGLPMDGTIEDPRGRSHDKPRLTLRCRQAIDWVRGASGAPIVSGGLVVGVLNKQLGMRNAEGTAQTAYQTVYGTPSSEIRAVFAELSMVDTGPFGELDDGVAAAQREYLHQFLRFYLGTDALPVGFGGRGDQLLALERWLADDDQPFGLLVAPAGRGKSALVVRWSETLRTERRARVVFVPISLRFETARLSDTVTVLLTRMRRVLGVAGPPPGDVSAAREEVARLSREAGAEDAPLLVVLDGLDEALDWRYDYSRLGLPPELPHWLKVIATYRSDPTATAVQIASRLGWAQGTVKVFDELLPLSPAGVGEALASVTPSATDLPAGITPDLYRLSGGDPLLLGLYLEQLVERLASGSIEGLVDDLKRWKPGWREYLAKWWEGQRKLWGADDLEDRRAATLLCLLAAALGPLTREELVEVSKPLDEKEKADEFTFRRVLTTVGRLVTGVHRITPKGEEQVALTLSHPQLAPFLRELFAHLDFARYDKLFLRWCHRTKAGLLSGQMAPRDVADYMVRHLPEHLVAAKATDELADLSGKAWRAVRSRIDGSDDAFLADVAEAWKHVEQRWQQDASDAQSVSDTALRLARCALITASGQAVEHWPADLIVTMALFGRWTESAMLAALRRHPAYLHSRMRAFAAVRRDLSRGALEALARPDGRS